MSAKSKLISTVLQKYCVQKASILYIFIHQQSLQMQLEVNLRNEMKCFAVEMSIKCEALELFAIACINHQLKRNQREIEKSDSNSFGSCT